jgi:imidazolonepropionase-like amidohydrolase
MKLRAWHCVLALLPLCAHAQDSSTATVTAFSGGRVIDGWGGTPIENGVVVIRGNKIQAVGPAASVAIPAGARTVDVNGMTVLP